MFAALDVHYDEPAGVARAAAVLFDHWEASAPLAEFTALCTSIAPYQPGEFFKRELPCLISVLQLIPHPLSLIIIDGYVTLGQRSRHFPNAVRSPSLGEPYHPTTSPPGIPAHFAPPHRPGLGLHLWHALGSLPSSHFRFPHSDFPLPSVPSILGVAKTRFSSATPIPLLRGASRTPLFITATPDLDPHLAASHIRRMHGPYRIPTLLKHVDQLARRE